MASSDQDQSAPTYDVFLNHRGPDTKKGFVYGLDQRLRKKGFQPFLDRKDIPYGDDVFQSIEEAVSKARMHIAIFSEDYADSTSCLHELHHIVLTGKPILTVFYDVKPEHLRRPRNPDGPFAAAFQKHDARKDPHVVQLWLNALEHAADLRGFIRDKKDYGKTDDELQRDIVIAVADKIRYPVEQEVMGLPIKFTEANNGEYSWVQSYELPEEGRGYVAFAVECSNDAMVAISPEPYTTEPMYEVVIGGWYNTESVIRRCAFPGPIVCKVPVGLLNHRPEAVNYLWVLVDEKTQLIQVGRGRMPSKESLFCIYKDTSFIHNARHVCFTSLDTPTTYSDIVVGSLDGGFSKGFTKEVVSVGEVRQERVDERSFVVPARRGIYNWAQHYALPEQGRGFVSFAARCAHDVHIAVSPERQSVNPMYEIVVGAAGNTQAWVRRKAQGFVLCNVAFALQPDVVNYIWVCVDATTQLIQVGRGRKPSPESLFCIYKDNQFIRDARYVCFSSWDTPVTYSGISVAALPTPDHLTLENLAL